MLIPDIEDEAKYNTNFREIIYTGDTQQIVLMSIPQGMDENVTTHTQAEQIVFVIEGTGEAILDNEIEEIHEDDIICIPRGVPHDIRNTSEHDLKLVIVYSSPVYPDGTVHATRNDALKATLGV